MQNQPSCVVLGGSFNPPTKAHKKLLHAAIDAVSAEQGIFVPSSDYYVKRKAQRQNNPYVLSEDERMELLAAMCGKGMAFSTCEYGDTSKGRTLQTLQEISRNYPKEYRFYFIMGADKMQIFHRWPTNQQILSSFGILWVSRDGIDIEAEIQKSPLLSRFRDTQRILDAPDGTDDVSSTAFWKSYAAGNPDYSLIDENARPVVERILATKS